MNDALASVVVPTVLPRAHVDSGRFYVRMAYACAGVAIAGFVPTYWAPVAIGSFAGPSILHLHGMVFSAWTILFVLQTRSAAAGRFDRHRALGLAGIALATAMLFLGLMVATLSLEGGIARGFEPRARAASIVPISIVLFFTATVAMAIANTRRPPVHMRLMLVATISILLPAVARVLLFFLAPPGAARPGLSEPPPVAFTLGPALAADVLLVVAIVHDWRTRGRPHRAYVVAGGLLLAMQFLRIPLSTSAAWRTITTWLLTATA
jgi:hypothetical protein